MVFAVPNCSVTSTAFAVSGRAHRMSTGALQLNSSVAIHARLCVRRLVQAPVAPSNIMRFDSGGAERSVAPRRNNHTCSLACVEVRPAWPTA